MARYDYLIVGGGMTADAAARGIREEDTKGSIGIVGADPHPPYNRPPSDEGPVEGRRAGQHLAQDRGGGGRSAPRPPSADDRRGGRRVTDDRGTAYEYRRLLLATGGEPRRLPDAPEGVIYLRTLDDYRATRQLADGGAGFVVLGGGFIGAEIAAALRMQGRDVTMIVPGRGSAGGSFRSGAVPLPGRVLPRARRPDAGSGSRPSGWSDGMGGSPCTRRAAAPIVGDAVIAGLGIVPSVDLARQAGLTVSDGIEVDDRLRTSQPEIYAAGDVAQFFNPALGKRMRVEHEDNANTMGKVAGQNMAGADLRYDHLPSFYSDLFDLGYEAVGRRRRPSPDRGRLEGGVSRGRDLLPRRRPGARRAPVEHVGAGGRRPGT